MAELADMLGDLLSDPKTADKLRGLLNGRQGTEPPLVPEKADKKAAEQSGGLAELISSNPDALSSIAFSRTQRARSVSDGHHDPQEQ